MDGGAMNDQLTVALFEIVTNLSLKNWSLLHYYFVIISKMLKTVCQATFKARP